MGKGAMGWAGGEVVGCVSVCVCEWVGERLDPTPWYYRPKKLEGKRPSHRALTKARAREEGMAEQI